MTIADKYLRIGNVGGKDYTEFVCGLRDYLDNHRDNYDTSNLIMNYLNRPWKPKLRESEKVILRSTNKQIIIFRDKCGNLWTRNREGEDNDFCQFNHLFKFIKNDEEYSIKELLGADNE